MKQAINMPQKSHLRPTSGAEQHLEKQLWPGHREIFRHCVSMLAGSLLVANMGNPKGSHDSQVYGGGFGTALSPYPQGDKLIRILVWLIETNFLKDMQTSKLAAGHECFSRQTEGLLPLRKFLSNQANTLSDVGEIDDSAGTDSLEDVKCRLRAKEIVETLKHLRLEDIPDEPSVETDYEVQARERRTVLPMACVATPFLTYSECIQQTASSPNALSRLFPGKPAAFRENFASDRCTALIKYHFELSRPQLIHSAALPWRCPHCDGRFLLRSDLRVSSPPGSVNSTYAKAGVWLT